MQVGLILCSYTTSRLYVTVYSWVQFGIIDSCPLIFCSRLAECDVMVTPAVTCIDGLCWWYIHASHLLSGEFNSIQFIQSTSNVWHWTGQSQYSLLQHWLFLPTWVRNKYTSPSAIQEKNQPNTISIEISPISRFEKCEWIVDMCCNVRLTPISDLWLCW